MRRWFLWLEEQLLLRRSILSSFSHAISTCLFSFIGLLLLRLM